MSLLDVCAMGREALIKMVTICIWAAVDKDRERDVRVEGAKCRDMARMLCFKIFVSLPWRML